MGVLRELVWINKARPLWWRLIAIVGTGAACWLIVATTDQKVMLWVITGFAVVKGDELLWWLYTKRSPENDNHKAG